MTGLPGVTAARPRSRPSCGATSYTDTGAGAPAPTATRCARSTRPATSPTRATRPRAPCPTRRSRARPGNLSATAGTGQVDLAWDAVHRQRRRDRLPVFRDGAPIATVGAATTSYSDTAARAGHLQLHGARAWTRPATSRTRATRRPPRCPTPSSRRAPGTSTRRRDGSCQVDLDWEASTDNVGVTGYDVYRDDQLIATRRARPRPTRTRARARHLHLLRGARARRGRQPLRPSNTATAPWCRRTTRSPTPPGNLTATLDGPTRSTSTGTRRATTSAVTGYEIYRDGALIATIGAGDLVVRHRRRAAATTSYAVRADRRRRQPLRPEQHRERDRARHRGPPRRAT